MSKATAGTTKSTAFWCMFAGRPTTCVSNHCNYGIRIFCGDFMVKFQWFWAILHPWRAQSNTGNDKSERVLMQFCRSVDGVRFWALRDRNSCFFMLISRWFVLHFGLILHDFELPSGSLISVYESSSKQLKTRNFHHFLKRFLRWKNRVIGDVWWIFWKMNTKFGRKKVIHFVVICIRVSRF